MTDGGTDVCLATSDEKVIEQAQAKHRKYLHALEEWDRWVQGVQRSHPSKLLVWSRIRETLRASEENNWGTGAGPTSVLPSHDQLKDVLRGMGSYPTIDAAVEDLDGRDASVGLDSKRFDEFSYKVASKRSDIEDAADELIEFLKVKASLGDGMRPFVQVFQEDLTFPEQLNILAELTTGLAWSNRGMEFLAEILDPDQDTLVKRTYNPHCYLDPVEAESSASHPCIPRISSHEKETLFRDGALDLTAKQCHPAENLISLAMNVLPGVVHRYMETGATNRELRSFGQFVLRSVSLFAVDEDLELESSLEDITEEVHGVDDDTRSEVIRSLWDVLQAFVNSFNDVLNARGIGKNTPTIGGKIRLFTSSMKLSTGLVAFIEHPTEASASRMGRVIMGETSDLMSHISRNIGRGRGFRSFLRKSLRLGETLARFGSIVLKIFDMYHHTFEAGRAVREGNYMAATGHGLQAIGTSAFVALAIGKETGTGLLVGATTGTALAVGIAFGVLIAVGVILVAASSSSGSTGSAALEELNEYGYKLQTWIEYSPFGTWWEPSSEPYIDPGSPLFGWDGLGEGPRPDYSRQVASYYSMHYPFDVSTLRIRDGPIEHLDGLSPDTDFGSGYSLLLELSVEDGVYADSAVEVRPVVDVRGEGTVFEPFEAREVAQEAVLGDNPVADEYASGTPATLGHLESTADGRSFGELPPTDAIETWTGLFGSRRWEDLLGLGRPVPEYESVWLEVDLYVKDLQRRIFRPLGLRSISSDLNARPIPVRQRIELTADHLEISDYGS